jgi:cyclopropane fatty-acyl-phospholipid synthase-like methyltransferase
MAREYHWLEVLAFGRTLQRARTAHLAALRSSRRILVGGDGDGRCVAQLARLAADARIHCIDSSAAMLREARRRVPHAARSRVTFELADVRSFAPAPRAWDAIVTMFVLDCLTPTEVRDVVGRLRAGLAEGGQWLFADFVVPDRGWRRIRARLWIGFLYRFFRWRTGLQITSVPPSEQALAEAGLVVVAARDFQWGLVRSLHLARRA